jgi:capsular polysaccharide biosynthesis protein
VNKPARTTSLPAAVSEDLREPIWPHDEFIDPGKVVAPSVGSGFVNLSFIGAAIGRGKRTVFVAMAIGLLLGCGLAVTTKPKYSASVSILLNENPQAQLTGLSTDSLLAEDPTMAAAAAKKLGLSMTAQAFMGTYTATLTTGQVLIIKATAVTAAQATDEANVVAAEFLKFRAQTLRSQASAAATGQDQQITADRGTVAGLQKQISTVSAEPSSKAQQGRLAELQSKLSEATSALTSVVTGAGAAEAAQQLSLSSVIDGTQILYSTPAAASPSHKKIFIEYIGGLFFIGLIVGLTIVIVGAVTSTRLRRRDDIAAALGAPVKLSVTSYTGAKGMLSNRGPGSKEKADLQRIVGYLKSVLHAGSGRPVTLGIVAVDNMRGVVPVVVALAAALARDGKRVAIADLSDGALARHVGETQPGVRKIAVGGMDVVLVVPEVGSELSTGPLRRETAGSRAQSAVDAACSGADFFLTFTALDPAIGSDYLATWATEAVVLITAGESSAIRIQTVGEMLHAAGLGPTSAIVLGADSADETLGSLPVA